MTLAGRGRRAAKALARHVREERIEPELVLCSTARRARETLERIEPALGVADVRFEPALYGASAGALLERLHDVPDDVGSVMLIGHNPGLQELALELAHTGPELHELAASSRPRRWPRSSYRTGVRFAHARVTSSGSCGRAISPLSYVPK